MEMKGKDILCGGSSSCRRIGEHEEVPEAASEEEVSHRISPAGIKSGLFNQKLKLCRCGRGQCKILTSKRDISKGRKFYCCPISTGADNHGCGMFEWVTAAEQGSCSSSNGSIAERIPLNHSSNLLHSNASYARGYLDGAIRGSEQQTDVLKKVLDALTKLDLHQK